MSCEAAILHSAMLLVAVSSSSRAITQNVQLRRGTEAARSAALRGGVLGVLQRTRRRSFAWGPQLVGVDIFTARAMLALQALY